MTEPGKSGGGAPESELPVVLALVPDLMVSMRIESTGRALGYAVRSCDSVTALGVALREVRPSAAVLDLTAEAFPLDETLAALRANGDQPPVLAFFPHVLKHAGSAARAAGCTIVVPRSRFMTDLAELLRSAVERNQSAL